MVRIVMSQGGVRRPSRNEYDYESVNGVSDEKEEKSHGNRKEQHRKQRIRRQQQRLRHSPGPMNAIIVIEDAKTGTDQYGILHNQSQVLSSFVVSLVTVFASVYVAPIF